MVSVGVSVSDGYVRAAVVTDAGVVLGRHRSAATPDNFDLDEALTQTMFALRPESLDAPVGLVFEDATLQTWSPLSTPPSLTYRVHHIAAGTAAAWAEHLYGVAAGLPDCLVVNVGESIEAGLVLNGQVVVGASGRAGDVGHMRFVPDGLPCPCGLRGCLTQYASGSALARRAQRPIGDVIAAAKQGKMAENALVAEVGNNLGRGLAPLVLAVDPAVIVVRGPMATAGELFLSPIRDALNEHTAWPSLRRQPQLRLSSLGEDATLLGAAAVARE